MIMGKVKKLAYKRRLRRIQKKKKRIKAAEEAQSLSKKVCCSGSSPCQSDDEHAYEHLCAPPTDHYVFSSFGSPGSPPSSPFSCLDDDDKEGTNNGENERVSLALYTDLEYKLQQTDRELHHCRQKLRQNEITMQKTEAECQRKIRSIRSFWRDKIYYEKARGGKILKMALQS